MNVVTCENNGIWKRTIHAEKKRYVGIFRIHILALLFCKNQNTETELD